MRNQPRSNRKKELEKKNSIKQRRSNYKLLTVVTFSLLSIYLVGYIVAFMGRPKVPIETVSYGTIDIPTVIDGLIIRDEVVVHSTMEGEPIYNYSENEKIKKDVLICSVKNIDTASTIEDEIRKIDKDIIDMQKLRSDISIFKEDIGRVEGNIDSAVNSYAYRFVNSEISDIYNLKSDIDKEIDLRTEIWLTENAKSMTELNAEKEEFQTQLSGYLSNYNSEKSGILSLYIDGYEDKFTPENILTITDEQVKMSIKPEHILKSKGVKVDDPLFKIITSNTWYIVSYIPNELCEEWETNTTKTISTIVGEEDKKVSVTIDNMVQGDKKTYVVFKTDQSLIEFLKVRSISFKVNEKEYSGFKIPNEAIIDKNFIKIPVDCVMESLGEKGVIKMVGGSGTFVSLRIARSDENFVYINQDHDTIKLGDIIVQGNGEDSTEYTVFDIYTYKGVYVANSSIAEFKIVTVLGQNNDYTIVSSENEYGLRIYDRIVSNASLIKENDLVY